MDSEKRKFDHSADGEPDPTPKKRVVGPSMPPTGSPVPEIPQVEDSETDDSDDDFGPGLPPSLGGPAAPVDIPDTTVHDAQTHSTEPPAKESGRDEWMLKPPEQGDWASKIDPTQLRARKFQTGKSARSGGASKELDAAWTETPEERMRRLGDEVMGVGKPSTNPAKQPPRSGPNKDQSTEEKVKKYNERNGKKARLENPKKAQKEEEDDPSARGFDREKDMALSSKLSGAQRREMVNRASDYSSRFSKGSYL